MTAARFSTGVALPRLQKYRQNRHLARQPDRSKIERLMDDLNDRLKLRSRECPSERGPQRDEIKGRFAHIGDDWKNVYAALDKPE